MQIDSYDTPDAEQLLAAGPQRVARRGRGKRELETNAVAALAFLAGAVAFAALAPWHRHLSIPILVLVIGAWVIIQRVQFPVAGGWTYPTMLIFVPALFVLPTPLVPLVGMSAILLRAMPALLRRSIGISMLPVMVADAWFTLAPAVLLVLTGTQRFAWAHWPVYVAAMCAEVVFDAAGAVGRCWFAERISPRLQLPLLTWIYLVDVALAPLGLVIAASAVRRPGLVALALSPTMVLVLFARERAARLERTQALSTAYRGTALLLGDIVEADDYYTGLHSRDVVDLAVAVANELGLGADAKRNVEFGSLLHDVGKIRVPKEIINKPGALDDAEWAIVRRHTIHGEMMLRQVGGTLASVGRIVRATHERYDGKGYPDRLTAEQIPIESRIIAACDAYSAMTTDRSYRHALVPADAMDELRRCAGSQFDPDVVDAIERLVKLPPEPLSKSSDLGWVEALTAGLSMYSRTEPPVRSPLRVAFTLAAARRR